VVAAVVPAAATCEHYRASLRSAHLAAVAPFEGAIPKTGGFASFHKGYTVTGDALQRRRLLMQNSTAISTVLIVECVQARAFWTRHFLFLKFQSSLLLLLLLSGSNTSSRGTI
jgi:hypothetical protein